jgi:nicotinate-nucleotide adenylyltransferase
MTRIGLLGGSFNPAHKGHRAISLQAMRALGLDEVWWLVSPGNPLKDGARDMAPFAARFSSATRMARGSRIRATAIGADNLAQFDQWRDWRGIARTVPIAVIARPGYDRRARASVAMGWLRRHRRPARQALNWTSWSLPALVFLTFRPDPTSATAIRAADPDWHAIAPPAPEPHS